MRRFTCSDDTQLAGAVHDRYAEQRPPSRFVRRFVSFLSACVFVCAPNLAAASADAVVPHGDELLAPIVEVAPPVTMLFGPEGDAVVVVEPSRIRALTDQVRSSVSAWAARHNAVILPRWHGPKPKRKYKQSTLFEMHSELGDSGSEVALRLSMKKRFIQFEYRF